jgi:hypothetical protein
MNAQAIQASEIGKDVSTTLHVLDLRHELADVKDRLRQAIDLLELSRDTIVQLRSHVATLEHMCVWSESSWRRITSDLMESQCASVLQSFVVPVASRAVVTLAVEQTPSQLSRSSALAPVISHSKARNMFGRRGDMQTPRSPEFPIHMYHDALSSLDIIHKTEHFQQAVIMAEQSITTQHLQHEVQRLKADMRLERYKVKQRDDARDKQYSSSLSAFEWCNKQMYNHLDRSVAHVADHAFASADMFALTVHAFLTELVLLAEATNHQRHTEDDKTEVVERHLEYMESIAQRLESMCMVVGTDDVLSTLSGHLRGQSQGAPSAHRRPVHGGDVEPSRLEALLLMSPGGD